MKYILNILFVFTIGLTYSQQGPIIRLNHLLVVVDSATYSALCDSSLKTKELWYSHQKQLKDWEGLYIIGENNYLEIFHPNSFNGNPMLKGENWTCYASMKSEYLESLSYDSTYVKFDEDDYTQTLSFALNDYLSPFEIWEMKALQYETWTKQWTKKEFESGMSFNPVDYNSPAESDSSKNYLFNDIVGITYTIPSIDSVKTIGFFEICGYSITERTIDMVSFDNGAERVTLFFKDEINTVLVNSIELKLNQNCRKKEYLIGLSKLVIDGNTAIWNFN
ncbi:MAG: DUF5829 family protein [Crocinitomicaceae bacterium]|nr:DUF5829 family protein [Crocinitomicaceae bacterium]